MTAVRRVVGSVGESQTRGGVLRRRSSSTEVNTECHLRLQTVLVAVPLVIS